MPPARRSRANVTRRAVLSSAAGMGAALWLGDVTSNKALAEGLTGQTAAGMEQAAGASVRRQDGYRIRVFTRTLEYRHDSIPDAVAALRALGAEHGFAVDQTEDPAVFTDDRLPSYRAVVFLMTTGDVL